MRDSFVFYSSYYEAISEFDEKTQLQIFKAVCEYALNGNIPELSGVSKAIFALIKPTIDANEKRYNNGKKGGRPKKNNDSENQKPMVLNSKTNGFENQKPNVNDNVNVNVTVNDNLNVNGNENDTKSGKPDRTSSKHPEEYEKIISYLNQKANTNYKASTKKTQQLINARLAEGYKTDDFFTVIDKKCAEWLNTDMEKFLRPETLFGNKFEGYLNQKTTNQKNDNSNGFNAEDYNSLVNNF